jgi:hypothetical protein
MVKKKSTNHYIDNKLFFEKMSEWKEKVVFAESNGDPKPPMTEYIGECFIKIATNLAMKPNFMNYSFVDEMIGDAIENCILYAHNFNPEKSKNPFSYFTQIIYYAFLRRIEKEKKQSYVKFKMIEEGDHSGHIHKWFKENYFDKNPDDAMKEFFQLNDNDLKKFEPKKSKKKTQAGLTSCFEDVNEDSNNK